MPVLDPEDITLTAFGYVGGNATADTNALVNAINYMVNRGYGGRIRHVPTAQPGLWRGEVISAAFANSGTLDIQLVGEGRASKIQVAEPLQPGQAAWIDIRGDFFKISGLTLQDPSNLLAGKAGLRLFETDADPNPSSAAGNSAPSLVQDVHFRGFELALEFAGAQNAMARRVYTENCGTSVLVSRGGTDCSVRDSYFANSRYGVIIDSPSSGGDTKHAEGFKISQTKIFCPDPNGYLSPDNRVPGPIAPPVGVWVKECLYMQLDHVEAFAIGNDADSGGCGLKLQPNNGKSIYAVNDQSCFWEGGRNGYSIWAGVSDDGSGGCHGLTMKNGYLSPSLKSNCSPLYLDAVQDAEIDKPLFLNPASPYGNVQITRSTGRVRLRPALATPVPGYTSGYNNSLDYYGVNGAYMY